MSKCDFYKIKSLRIQFKDQYDCYYIKNVEVQEEMFKGTKPEYDSSLTAEENITSYARWANPHLWHVKGEDTVVFENDIFLDQDYIYTHLILRRLDKIGYDIEDVETITEVYSRRYTL